MQNLTKIGKGYYQSGYGKGFGEVGRISEHQEYNY